jgi:hypothetical protein
VAQDALCRPSCEILLHARGDQTRLQAQGVSAEVG